MATDIEIIVGTYEEYLLGYKLERSIKDPDQLCLKKSFASHCHTASVRCVATMGKYLASGGADDKIFIYDMIKRCETSLLNAQMGTVNTIAFTPDCTHLLTGGSDGAMIAYSCTTWEAEKIWKDAHKGSSVNHLTIHPSGKLALSIGAELILRTWNLVKGRQAYATNLKSKPTLGRMVECVEWSPCGSYFALTGARIIEVWNVETAAIECSMPCEAKPICVCWISENDLVVGLENGSMLLFNLRDEKPKVFQAYEKRIKAINSKNNILGTVGSSGEVTAWRISEDRKNITKLCSTNIGCRPTCVAIVDSSKFSSLKKEDGEENQVISENEMDNPDPVRVTGSVTVEMDEDDGNRKKENKQKKKRKHKDKNNIVVEKTKDDIIPKKKKKEKEMQIESEESNVVHETPVKKVKSSKKEKNKSMIVMSTVDDELIQTGNTSDIARGQEKSNKKKKKKHSID